MDHYDFIIAGGGAGGLSLAYHLARSPVRRIFRFLDEAGSWGENIQLLATLPPASFVKALYNVKLRQ
jgi:glycine/D-amino acid oxidase-like deaminating enzyme